MEHGAVWITYEPDLPQDQKDELRQIVESQDCLLASPYPDLPTPVVASAWGKQLTASERGRPRPPAVHPGLPEGSSDPRTQRVVYRGSVDNSAAQ